MPGPADIAPRAGLTRRRALAALGLGAAAVVAGSLGSACSLLGRRPNVILIVADDLGYGDLRCYGAADVFTPHIDALSGRGLRFTQFYVTAPACTPSRTSLLTGRQYPRALHLGQGMNGTETTIAEMLKGVGYRTAVFGKWHLGFDDGMYPDDQGFDEFLGCLTGAMDSYSHYYYWGGADRHVLRRNRERWHEEGTYFPDIIVRESLRFIEASGDRPFFLYLPFTIPHYPVQPDPAILARYAHIADPARRQYAAAVTTLDDRVGQILGRLDDLGLRDDTVVLFLSDHGPSAEERSGGGGSAGALRGSKMSLWEGGIRVPFVLSWPGRYTGGESRPQPVSAIDILPTLAELCDAPLPRAALDGVSLDKVCAAADSAPPHDVLYWVYMDDWAVREGTWKVVGHRETTFLANLASDPTESRDWSGSHPHVRARLVDLYNRWILDLSRDPNVITQAPGASAPGAPAPQ